MNTTRSIGLLLITTSWLLGAMPARGQVMIYETTFDKVATGRTQPFPGAPGQAGWYRGLAVGDAYGEVQTRISRFGRALHEHTSATVPPHSQTIDLLRPGTVTVTGSPFLELSLDFYAATSDVSKRNPYVAGFHVRGGPHPGFSIVDLALGGGNSSQKSVTGVNVGLGAFNGIDNIVPIPLTVGQRLAWGSWHHVSVVIDQARDTYVSVTVDGETQDLSAYLLPRSLTPDGWVRGQEIETLGGVIIPVPFPGEATDDDVYWDNVSLRFIPGPGVPLLSLRLAKTQISGCLKNSGTLNLTSPAPAGGLTVALESDNAHATVPASLLFKPGVVSRTFPILTAPVASIETVKVEAAVPGQAVSAILALKPMAPKKVSLAPNPVVGGSPVDGAVILECPAGPGDIVVALSSSKPGTAAPTASSITIPVGAASGPFVVTTTPVAVLTKTSLRARANGTTRSATLFVNPAP